MSRVAGANLGVEGVQPAGVNANQDMARSGFGTGGLSTPQRPARFFHDVGPHNLAQSLFDYEMLDLQRLYRGAVDHQMAYRQTADHQCAQRESANRDDAGCRAKYRNAAPVLRV